ncbi:MAG: hypothetical protein ACLR7O_06155 [Ruminococcus callidus]|jgi:hypothetical protein
MRSGQIPNNPYIIAKNVPHPGAFFVFGGGVAAIVVQQLKFMLQKNKPLLKGEGDQRSWWRGFGEIFFMC